MEICLVEQNGAIIRPSRQSIMAKLFKALFGYDGKYNRGTKDNFEHKFLLFMERYELADILQQDKKRAFKIVSTGNTWQFYFHSLNKIRICLLLNSKLQLNFSLQRDQDLY